MIIIKELRYFNLEPVNLQVNDSECIGLTGPSGSGKSLFLRALADLDEYRGSVLLNGRICRDFKPTEWRKQVGLLPAESSWWFDTVGEHFNKVESSWFGRLGFDNNVTGWQVSRLSSGEKQRLALLRLLINRPKVLLLDEPTANLDEKFTEAVEHLLFEFKEQNQASLIWVGHDTRQLERVASSVYFIKDNKIIRGNVWN
ncbi:ATP-binding cassette domain-containing protein [candidate division KSB1 bacterium]|nr:ATP-binding cassette domain-containing protein [candidate division KSB1 bacterium]